MPMHSPPPPKTHTHLWLAGVLLEMMSLPSFTLRRQTHVLPAKAER